MRSYSFLVLPVAALTLGAAFLASPASAQTPMVAPAPTYTPTPTPLYSPVTAPPLSQLSIPVPPGGRLRVEMDARSEDILGVMKSFLKGIGETNSTARAVDPARPIKPNPIADALAGGDLADILKDVNHVHFVVYEMPGAKPPVFAPPMPMMTKPLGKKGGKSLMAVPAAPVALPTPPVPTFDSNAFYETAFSAEGAHRLLFTDADEYKLVMVGFPDRKGYAYAVSGGGYVVVSRSDGYPNMEALTAFLSRITDAALRSQTMNKMIKDGMKAGKDSSDTDSPDTDLPGSDPAASSLKK